MKQIFEATNNVINIDDGTTKEKSCHLMGNE